VASPSAREANVHRGRPDAALSLRSASVPFPRSLEESWLGEYAVLTIAGSLTKPSLWPVYVILPLVAFGPLIGYGIALFHDDLPLAPLPVLAAFAALFCWVGHRGLRGHRAAELLNAGRLDESQRLLARGRFGVELLHGLIAQLRADHARAAAAYRSAIAVTELRPVLIQPILAQAYAREAIALTNLGRFDEAHQRLQKMPVTGEYLSALALVAYGYLVVASGQVLTLETVQRLEHTFRPIRGAWGGLALAARGRAQMGDAAACRSLVEEERKRAHADELAAILPLLFTSDPPETR
jgi:tetratricopeptide (TPR) repeat protein